MDIRLCAPADIRSLAGFLGESDENVAPGLGGTAITPLIQGFLSRGHRVTLYTLSRGLNEECYYEWGNLRVFVGPYRSGGLARTYFDAEIAYLMRAIDRDGAAFVHAHWTYEFALAPLRLGIPTVVTIHDLPWKVLSCFKDLYRSVRLVMAYEVALRGERFTAVSQEAAQHFSSCFRHRGKIDVIPNGLKDEVFQAGVSKAKAERDAIVFGTILQGWSKRKNPEIALQSFAEVRKSIPGAELRMYGSGYEAGGPGNRWAMQRELHHGVTFVGVLPNAQLLQAIASEVDVVVHPSLDEALSVTVLESMALRKPIIAGRSTPGMQELLDAGNCGVLTDVREVESLRQSMLRLGGDAGLRAELGEKAQSRAWARFRLCDVLEQYENLYESAGVREEADACPCC